MYFSRQVAIKKLEELLQLCSNVPISFFLANYDVLKKPQMQLIKYCLQFRKRRPEDKEALLDFLTDDSIPEEERVLRFELLPNYVDDREMMKIVIGSISPSNKRLQGKLDSMCYNLEFHWRSLLTDPKVKDSLPLA